MHSFFHRAAFRAGRASFALAAAWLLMAAASVQGQNFQNLGFETAGLYVNQSVPGVYPVAMALPGWSVSYGTNQQSEIEFDNISTGAPQVTLLGKNNPEGGLGAIEGSFSVFFQGGTGVPDEPYVSISQTGLIPTGSMSIQFKAYELTLDGPMLLSFDGQNIPYYALATGPNYTLYGGDVSSFAGTTGPLEFSVSGFYDTAILDSIVFSASPVPEPATCVLILGGAVLFVLKGRRALRPFWRSATPRNQ